MYFFTLLAYFVTTTSIFECKSSKTEINKFDSILKRKYLDEISQYLTNRKLSGRDLPQFDYLISKADVDEPTWNDDQMFHKRAKYTKKYKSLTHNGYSLDMNLENFKSMRYCYYNEVCKNRYKPYFECVCPKSTLCTGQGGLFEGTCTNHLMPYVWVQSVDENQIHRY